jgi:hypothetical protein
MPVFVVKRNVAAVAVVAAMAVGCPGKKEQPRQILPAPIGSVVIDTADELELPPGDVEAFGLKLPRGMSVKARFPDAVYAHADMGLEPIGNYMRAHVEAGRVDTGPAKTVFDKAKVKGDTHVVRVEVTLVSRERVEVVVRDETPRPDPTPGLSEDERWRRAGMAPGGKKPLDDKHAE